MSDKAIYDWSSINLAAPNRLMDRTFTTNVQLEQKFLNTPRQLLVAQAFPADFWKVTGGFVKDLAGGRYRVTEEAVAASVHCPYDDCAVSCN